MNYELQTANSPMFCPECNLNLQPISLKSETGDVVLDFCGNCAGVWSDQGEVNYIKYNNLIPLENSLPNTPFDPHADYQFLMCPKDRSPLRFFRRESVPQYLSLMRCSQCSGIWFPKKSLIDFKRAQEAKVNYFQAWKIPLPSIYAVLLPLLVLAILGSGIFSIMSGTKQGQDMRIKAQELISPPKTQFPDTTSVVINFTTQKPEITKLRYWKDVFSKIEIPISAIPQTSHYIVLKNLDSQTKYSYEIILISPDSLQSPIYTFTTE